MSTKSELTTTTLLAQDALQRTNDASGGGGSNVNSVTGKVGALGPASVVTFNAPAAITQQSSGKFLISFTLSGTDATPSDTLSIAIGEGAAVLLTEVCPVGADAGGTWHFALSFLATTTDGLPHTYKCSATSVGTHNLTVAANQGYVSIIEVP
jgi:hypothetical protein